MPGHPMRLALLLLGLACALNVRAGLQDEIEVFDNTLAPVGQNGVSIHLNTSPRGRTTPDFAGEVVPHRAWRSMLELSRGVSDGLEVGLHIPFVIDRDGKPYAAGLRPRLRWIPVRPTQDEAGAFLGLNLEYSDIKREFERPARHIEWRPILGWRGPEWTIAANPALTTWLSDSPRPHPEFSFNAMVKRQVSGHTRVGLEYYSAYGPVDAFLPPAQRDQLLFLAADFVVAGYVVNAGIGHALTPHADHTVLKLQVTLP